MAVKHILSQLSLRRGSTPSSEREWPYLLGMTSGNEQQHYETLAQQEVQGIGELVDLGCWLGSTTISLARGLKQNPNPAALSRKIFAYDRFEWEEYMQDIVRNTRLQGKFRGGDSFLGEYKRRVAPWAEQIQIHPGDLLKQKWHGAPIELLLVDAMKSVELTNTIWSQFYPYLVPGHSLVVHQDFGHYFVWWIHLLHYRLRNSFALFEAVPLSSTVTFRYCEPIAPDRFQVSWDFGTFTDAEIDEAYDYWLEQIKEPFKQGHLAGAHVKAYIDRLNMHRAREISDQYLERGVSLDAYMPFERRNLERMQILRPKPETPKPIASLAKRVPSEAVARGIEFLQQRQRETGEFHLTTPERDRSVNDIFYDASPFATMHILCSLDLIGHPGAQPIVQSGLEYLERQMVGAGLWRMWANPDSRRGPKASLWVPPDLNSTSCCSYLLKRHGKVFPDNRGLLLANRNQYHLFKTWLVPRAFPSPLRLHWKMLVSGALPWRIQEFWRRSGADSENMDIISNSHALLYLGSCSETQPIVSWLLWAVSEKRETESDRFYRDAFAFHYALSRNYFAGVRSLGMAKHAILERFEHNANPDGSIGRHALHTALALNALRNFELDSPIVEPALGYLLENQRADGAWQSTPFLWDRGTANQWWGSEELTTALALEALARWSVNN